MGIVDGWNNHDQLKKTQKPMKVPMTMAKVKNAMVNVVTTQEKTNKKKEKPRTSCKMV